MFDEHEILARLDGSVQAVSSLRERVDQIQFINKLIIERLDAGATLFTCGNGGSAAQALHLAEEMIGRYRANRPAVRAVCLNADPTAITCIANDFGFENIFARQCEALVDEGDVLVVLSTSGNSENISRAVQTSTQRGAHTIGLLGHNGGTCKDLCDHALIVAGEDAAHIQEAHQVVIHLMCEAIERTLAAKAAE